MCKNMCISTHVIPPPYTRAHPHPHKHHPILICDNTRAPPHPCTPTHTHPLTRTLAHSHTHRTPSGPPRTQRRNCRRKITRTKSTFSPLLSCMCSAQVNANHTHTQHIYSHTCTHTHVTRTHHITPTRVHEQAQTHTSISHSFVVHGKFTPGRNRGSM